MEVSFAWVATRSAGDGRAGALLKMPLDWGAGEGFEAIEEAGAGPPEPVPELWEGAVAPDPLPEAPVPELDATAEWIFAG